MALGDLANAARRLADEAQFRDDEHVWGYIISPDALARLNAALAAEPSPAAPTGADDFSVRRSILRAQARS